jgi:hypothetical protein
MTRHIDATFYAQVEPTFNYNRENVRSAKVVALTQKKPDRPRGGTVLLKLTVRVPEAAFLPLRPEAIVVIPEDMAIAQPIEVEAVAP